MSRMLWMLTVCALWIAPAALAEDWPGFGGPDGDNTSDETNLADTWPDEGPTELWAVEIGPGFGAPAVADGEVFLLDRVPDERDILRCFDLDTGEEKWQYAYEAPGEVDFPGSRTTPAVDDGHVYTVGSMGQVHCISRETHEPVWSLNLLEDFGGRRPNWGVSVSPLLLDDMVILAVQGRYAGVVAVNKDTGEVLWRSEPIGHDMAYTTPMLVTIDGLEQILLFAKEGLFAFDPADGTILWRHADYRCSIPIPNPTVLPDGRIFLTGGYGAGSAIIYVSRDDQQQWQVQPLRTVEDCGSQIHPGLLIDEHLYVVSFDNRRREGLTCLQPDGRILWQAGEQPNLQRGCILYADGKIYALEGDSGVLRLIEPSPEGYRELAHAQVVSDGNKWAPMALADGRLLLRDQSTLKCLDVSAAE